MTQDLDFGHYEMPQVETREFKFADLEHQPTLTVRVAYRTNAEYLNAILSKTGRGGVSGDAMTEAQQEEAHRNAVRAFARHVVTGWRNVFARVGGTRVPATFSAEACEMFLSKIPLVMFDDLVKFCANPRNFFEDAPTPSEVKNAEGN